MDDHQSTTREASKSKRSRRIQWDEQVISKHDLDRGTRMKIDEPNTPYHYYEEPTPDEIQQSISIDQLIEPKSPPLQTQAQQRVSMDQVTQRLELANVRLIGLEQAQAQTHAEEGERQEEKDQRLVEMETRDELTPDKFSQKRKLHYNEFQLMQEWKLKHAAETEEEEEEKHEQV